MQLTNMLTKREEKFRRVRLANAAFAAKVAAVPGGLDVMLSAGFQLQSDDAEAYLLYTEPFVPVALRLRVTMHRLLLAKQSLEAEESASVTT
jgi:PUB domain